MTRASSAVAPSIAEILPPGATLLEVRAVSKRFGAREVLKTLSLEIAAGEFLTLLGESGSGKTTLLRLIAGFEQPTAGEIWMHSTRIDTLPPYKRRVNTVFQQYALFPHLNVSENVAYGLHAANTPKAEIATRVADALAMGWPLNTAQLRKLNFPIGETIPKENTTGWIDHLMITSASKNKDLASEFLAYMVEAKTQKLVSDVTHYTPANPDAAVYLSSDEKKSLHLDDPNSYMMHIYFWQDVPRRAKYNEIWNEVKAAQ